MKKLNILFLSFLLILFSSACQDDIGDHIVRGEDLSQFTTLSPESNAFIAVNIGQPEKQVLFSWNASESGLGSNVTYKLLFDNIDGDFSMPLLTIASDNEGSATSTKVKYSDLQKLIDELKKDGDTEVTVSWAVEASNGSEYMLKSESSTFKMPVSNEGLSSVMLGLPVDKFVLDLNGGEDILFNWTKSNPTVSGTVVKYQLLIDNINGDFSDPIVTLDSDNTGLDTLIRKSPSDFKDALAGKLNNNSYKWTIKAYTDNLSIFAEDVKTFFLPTRPSMYIVGNATEVGWNIDDAIELKWRSGHNAYMGYIPLKNGNFKFFPVKGSWDNGMGRITDTEDPKGGLLGGDNKDIPCTNTTDNFKLFRVAVWFDTDADSYKYSILDAEMILVGDATPAGWSIDNGFNMVYAGEGKWVTYVNMNATGGFKFFYESGNWNSGYKEFDATNSPGELSLEGGDPNISTPGDGYYKLIIDTYNMTYTKELIASKKMYLVGSPNGWDINAGIEMTWDDTNKEWTLTIDLAADDAFKIFAESGNWDSGFKFKYEMLNFEGGDPNISTPDGVGNYTIKFSLATRTLTFTKN